MNLYEELSKPLDVKDIDFRLQSIVKGGYAIIVAYKDARVDIKRLNEVVGCLGWKREHTRDNKNCIVSIWDKENKQWVSKEDTGKESNTEKEKGLASDSFKRACFNWGIGIELYEYPFMFIKLNDDEYLESDGKFKQTNKLRINDWNWNVEFKDGILISLKATYNNSIRYNYSLSKINKKTPEQKPQDRKPALTLDGFEFLKTKGTKEQIRTALDGRRMSADQREVLNKLYESKKNS